MFIRGPSLYGGRADRWSLGVEVEMSIYRAQYSRYRGALEPSSRRHRAIAAHELRRITRDKWFRRLVVMSGFPALVLGVFVYLAAVLEQSIGWDPLGGEIFTRLYAYQPWFILLIFAAFGSAQISRDIKSRALTLVFTRTVTPLQYVLGKIGAMMACALFVTLVPGVLLGIAQFAMTSTFGFWSLLDTLWRVALVSVLIAWLMSSLILLLSAVTGTSSRVTGMIWLVAFICLIMVRQLVSRQLGTPGFAAALSPYDIAVGTAEFFFAPDVVALPPLIACVVFSAFFTYALWVRIQSFERSYT